MITSEQVSKDLQIIMEDDFKFGKRYLKYQENYSNIARYILQQEKVNELLEVYRKREANRNLPHPSHADEIIYTRKIEKLESELNE